MVASRLRPPERELGLLEPPLARRGVENRLL